MRSGTPRLKTLLLAVLFLACAVGTATAAYAIDWVVLVDDTGTMRHQSRGEMTVKAIGEFVSLIERGDHVSVCSYGERPALALPTSPVVIEDESSRDYVRANTRFGFNADRTDITAGLEYVWRERSRLFPGLGAHGGKGAAAVIVLLTDGKLIPVYDDFANYDETYTKSRRRLLELASLCAKDGIRIYTIGLGREERVDGKLLTEVSARTGGTYRHVAVASDVVGAYRAIAGEQRPSALAEAPKARTGAVARPASEDVSVDGFRLQDVASASETPGPLTAKSLGDEAVGASPSSGSAGFPSEFCLASAGILAIFIGMIAVGTEKRQKWAAHFSTNLFGTGETRVRGYLKPIDVPGTSSARVCIGLENSGVESVRVGSGTSFIPHVEATVEFIGTKDGSPPELHVESGNVTVEGEAAKVRKLRDGDVVDIDGARYQYLRGHRR
jgi:Mg-chelatase subunit ChlD